jgi:hypothetical protein
VVKGATPPAHAPRLLWNRINPADLSTEEVPFDVVGSQQPVGTTATITMADFDDDDDDDDVSPQFNSPQVRTHLETMVTRRSVEVMGLMGSEASVPSLFSGQTGASTVVGTIMGNNLSCLGPRIDEQTASNDPLAHSDLFSRNHNRTDSGLGVSHTPTRTDIINHFIKICGFSHDSLMVKYIDQQQWSELAHIVMHGLEDSKDFDVFQDDGFATLGKPMLIHQKLIKSFLLYSKRQTLWEEEGPSEAEVMCWTPEEFKAYLTTKAFHDDHAEYCGPRYGIPPISSNGSGNQGVSRLTPGAPGAANRMGALTAQEF